MMEQTNNNADNENPPQLLVTWHKSWNTAYIRVHWHVMCITEEVIFGGVTCFDHKGFHQVQSIPAMLQPECNLVHNCLLWKGTGYEGCITRSSSQKSLEIKFLASDLHNPFRNEAVGLRCTYIAAHCLQGHPPVECTCYAHSEPYRNGTCIQHGFPHIR